MDTRNLDIGDKVYVKMYRLIGPNHKEFKWFPGQVMEFGASLVYIRLKVDGKNKIYPFEGKDIRSRR